MKKYLNYSSLRTKCKQRGNLFISNALCLVLSISLQANSFTNYLGEPEFSLPFTKTKNSNILSIPLNAPTNLTAQMAGKHINLEWIDNSTNETAFILEYKVNNDEFKVLKKTAPNVSSYKYTEGHSGFTYTFRIKGINSSGTSSYSNEAVISSSKTPNAPTNLTFTLIGKQLILNWTDNSNNEEKFTVEYKTYNGTYTALSNTNPNITSITHTLSNTVTTWYFRVLAVNSIGGSAYSNEVIVAPSEPPSIPSNLTARLTGTQVHLAWTDNSNNEETFVLEYKVNYGSFKLLKQTSPNETKYKLKIGHTDSTYTFRIKATNFLGSSGYSNEAFIVPSGPPLPPSSLTASLIDNKVTLNWTDNSNNEQNFLIEYKTDSTNFETLVYVDHNITTYNYSINEISKTLIYRVKAINPIGESAFSNEAILVSNNPPSAPTNLTVHLINDTVFMNWEDNSIDEQKFVIENKINEGVFSQLTEIEANTSNYSYSMTNKGLTLTYRVNAINSNGSSDYSNEAVVNVPFPIAAPSNLTAVINDSKINLHWTDNSDDELGFIIEQGDSAAINFSVIDTTDANAIDYSILGLKEHVFYTFRVMALGIKGKSLYSNVIRATVPYKMLTLNTEALGDKFNFKVSGAIYDSTKLYESGSVTLIELKPDSIISELPEMVILFNSKNGLESFKIKLQMTDSIEIRNVLFEKDGSYFPLNDHFYDISKSTISLFTENKVQKSTIFLEGVQGILKNPAQNITVKGLEKYTNATLAIFNTANKNIPLRTITGNLIWDGKDADGVAVLSGVYLLVVNLNDGSGIVLNNQIIIK